MKATKEQMNEELMVIKMFAGNYARDLSYNELWVLKEDISYGPKGV
jgi:hypothetical protein